MSWEDILVDRDEPIWEQEKQQAAKLRKEIKELELEIRKKSKELAALMPKKRVSDAGGLA